jgi:hypothetical protein
MGLFSAIGSLLTTVTSGIPIVGEAVAAGTTFLSENEEVAGFLTRAGGSLASGQASKSKSGQFKYEPAPTPRASGMRRLSVGSKNTQQVSLPGLNNPYMKNLYQSIDLRKVRGLNDILKHNDILKTPTPQGPKGPNIKQKFASGGEVQKAVDFLKQFGTETEDGNLETNVLRDGKMDSEENSRIKTNSNFLFNEMQKKSLEDLLDLSLSETYPELARGARLELKLRSKKPGWHDKLGIYLRTHDDSSKTPNMKSRGNTFYSNDYDYREKENPQYSMKRFIEVDNGLYKMLTEGDITLEEFKRETKFNYSLYSEGTKKMEELRKKKPSYDLDTFDRGFVKKPQPFSPGPEVDLIDQVIGRQS